MTKIVCNNFLCKNRDDTAHCKRELVGMSSSGTCLNVDFDKDYLKKIVERLERMEKIINNIERMDEIELDKE